MKITTYKTTSGQCKVTENGISHDIFNDMAYTSKLVLYNYFVKMIKNSFEIIILCRFSLYNKTIEDLTVQYYLSLK